MYKNPQKPSLFFHILEEFLLLPFGRKVVFISSFVGVISLFLPWFSEGLKTYDAFGKFTLMGYMLFAVSSSIFWISVRECFFKKPYFFTIANYYAYILLLIAGIYTVILDTSALYELLNYNPRANLSFGATVLFISYGLSLGGVLLSKSYVPPITPIKKEKNPNDINVSKTSLHIDTMNT